MATQNRVPPGQYLTEKWPVLHYGSIPRFDPARWNFRIFGLADPSVTLSYAEFMALPQTTLTCDIHCVTAWSRLGVAFEGVRARDVLALTRVHPDAKYALVHAEQGFTANLPLEFLLADDALFAHRADGQNLAPEHGWPLRLLVPRLYFWKSAKWARGLELTREDRPGFWEQRGYHMKGDPWKEERYGDPW